MNIIPLYQLIGEQSNHKDLKRVISKNSYSWWIQRKVKDETEKACAGYQERHSSKTQVCWSAEELTSELLKVGFLLIASPQTGWMSCDTCHKDALVTGLPRVSCTNLEVYGCTMSPVCPGTGWAASARAGRNGGLPFLSNACIVNPWIYCVPPEMVIRTRHTWSRPVLEDQWFPNCMQEFLRLWLCSGISFIWPPWTPKAEVDGHTEATSVPAASPGLVNCCNQTPDKALSLWDNTRLHKIKFWYIVQN